MNDDVDQTGCGATEEELRRNDEILERVNGLSVSRQWIHILKKKLVQAQEKVEKLREEIAKAERNRR